MTAFRRRVRATERRSMADSGHRTANPTWRPMPHNARGEPPRLGRHPPATQLPLARSAPLLCSAQSLTLLLIGTPRCWSTWRDLLEPEDGSECSGYLFHVGVIDVAEHANDTAFIDDPNLLAEDHRIVG